MREEVIKIPDGTRYITFAIISDDELKKNTPLELKKLCVAKGDMVKHNLMDSLEQDNHIN